MTTACGKLPGDQCDNVMWKTSSEGRGRPRVLISQAERT